MIDTSREFCIHIEGVTRGRWLSLATAPAEINLSEVEDTEQALEQALDEFNSVINEAYKTNRDGYVQLGNTSINILRFDAIRVSYVQDSNEQSTWGA